MFLKEIFVEYFVHLLLLNFFVVFWTNFYCCYLSFYFLFKGVKDYVGAKYLFFHFLLKFYRCYLCRALYVALWQILEEDELYTHCFDTKEEQPTTHLSV